MLSSSSLSSTPSVSSPTQPIEVKTLAITGGTHGNEYTGVWIVRHMLENEAQRQRMKLLYPSLDITPLISNPIAHENNRRFIDMDLNRLFTTDILSSSTNDTFLNTVEGKRCYELNQLLGPKLCHIDSNIDMIIDLHTTTSNMGVTLIVCEGDVLMTQAAAYVMYQCNQLYSKSKRHQDNNISTTTRRYVPDHDYPHLQFETRILMHPAPNRTLRPNLSSVGKHGLTIEVGPIPQGLLRHDTMIQMEIALHFVLEFIERYNYQPHDVITSLIQYCYPHYAVPCYRSARAQNGSGNLGKITWPSHPQNSNFPLYIIHQSLQDRDFEPVHVGDPLFMTIHGETIYYDGTYGDTVYLIFINEGGYYYASSGTGIGVAIQAQYHILHGTFVTITTTNDHSPDDNNTTTTMTRNYFQNQTTGNTTLVPTI